MEYVINHKPTGNRFEAIIDNHIIGYVDYMIAEQGLMTVYHTKMSEGYEGKGIAGAMTRALLEFAKQERLRINPVCSYTKRYIEQHSEYAELSINKQEY
ncbi:MAG: hypothetical protein RL662_2439 [Bacteroidota bacterium]|jgi:predicted GNAT family acetyltransferase